MTAGGVGSVGSPPGGEGAVGGDGNLLVARVPSGGPPGGVGPVGRGRWWGGSRRRLKSRSEDDEEGEEEVEGNAFEDEGSSFRPWDAVPPGRTGQASKNAFLEERREEAADVKREEEEEAEELEEDSRQRGRFVVEKA